MLWLPLLRSRSSTTLFPKFCSFSLIKLQHNRRWYFLLGSACTRFCARQKMKHTRALLSEATGHCWAGMGSNPVPFIWEALQPAIWTWVHSVDCILHHQCFILCCVYFCYFSFFFLQISTNTLVSVTAGCPFLACSAFFIMSWARIYLRIVDHIAMVVDFAVLCVQSQSNYFVYVW